MQFLPLLYIFFIPVLSRPSFTSRNPDKDQEIEQTSTVFSFKSYNPEMFMSSTVNVFVHAGRKRSQKVPHAKSGTFRFAWTDSHESTTIL